MLAALKQIEKQPVTLGALRRALPRDVRVMLYDALPSRGNMDSVMGKHKGLIVLYQLHDKSGAPKDQAGHYSTILKLGKNKYEFFSSYGMTAEQEIHLSHSEGKLIRLLGKNYIRSSARLQDRFQSNTCARWAAARCLLREVPLQVFVKHFSGKLHLQKPDDIITLATLFMFNK